MNFKHPVHAAGTLQAKLKSYHLCETKPVLYKNNEWICFKAENIFLVIALWKQDLFWKKHGKGFQMKGVHSV